MDKLKMQVGLDNLGTLDCPCRCHLLEWMMSHPVFLLCLGADDSSLVLVEAFLDYVGNCSHGASSFVLGQSSCGIIWFLRKSAFCSSL